MASTNQLANGEPHGGSIEGDRGLVGDTYKKLRSNQGISSLFNKITTKVHGLEEKVKEKLSGDKHSHTHAIPECPDGTHDSQHRFNSFAAPREGNDVKWFVDGCSYMWAVSVALERAKESIWIMDWWLSPELYLRRPPSMNEQYRLDRMLQAAAQRGVKINVVVYKEVTQALTLSSYHTKHALEALHPNIAVFRHPDHLPDAQTLESSFISSLKNFSLTPASAAQLPLDALKAIYGMNDDVILYWAHHEKLCLIDREVAFMGGLDLCYGRWDTNQHPIADAHPGNLNDIVFPGQDFNNARIMDFSDVQHWQDNKLDRKQSSRMGWSDISMCLRGPAVDDLMTHFVERWNFIYNEKYDARSDGRYTKIKTGQGLGAILHAATFGHQSGPASGQNPVYVAPPQTSNQGIYFPPPPVAYRGFGQAGGSKGLDNSQQFPQEIGHQKQGLGNQAQEVAAVIKGRIEKRVHKVEDDYLGGSEKFSGTAAKGAVSCQIVRSATKWSHGVSTEHSIANAYITVIQNSQHFVYIENQFFITTTCEAQRPAKNKIGKAIVDRIVRAAKAGEKYKVIVVMPAIPAFAGDLKDDGSLGTRAIMKYQYDSINRGGYSIMEMIAKEGIVPTDYIRFYNLRNYDRINVSASMQEAEIKSGVNYELARREHDDQVDPMGYRAQGGAGMANESATGENYQKYQQAANDITERRGPGTSRWDSVSECYMLGGPDIREIPWEGGEIPEMDCFVSEELYIHSKVLIADDRVVICGSANLNDRSQLGSHDSEIAIVVEDPEPMQSYMNGQPWQASKFAASLRRQLFRKHLGLLKAQDFRQPDANFQPIGVPNEYDFGSAEDRAVMDPLSDQFLNLWNTRAKQNTDAFSRVFHPVPHDSVKTWADYDVFYENFFHEADREADGDTGKKTPAKYRWGHVVDSEFSPGQQGVREMKDVLSTIKGTLVEMPLLFLIKENIAQEGFSLNAFTEEVYT